jgi:HSP20 family protein
MRKMLASFMELVHLQSEMNKLFESLQILQRHEELPEVGFSAPYDVLETPEEVIVEVDLPGVNPASLDVAVKGHVIQLQGSRERSQPTGILAYHLMERSRGNFTRRLVIDGAVDTHRAWAAYEGGVLILHFPKVPDRRGQLVKIPLRKKE